MQSPTASRFFEIQKNASPVVNDFIRFVEEGVTPFHVVANMKRMLAGAGFNELVESAVWPQLTPGGKYFVTRNDSTIVAFAVGGQWKPGNGIKIVGAHTDSPNLALKPKTYSKKGAFMNIGTQCYGGGLWHTWFDRDLTIAGRLMIQREGQTRLSSQLVNIQKPILRISNLAIHLRTAAEREAFSPNKETHVVPAIATELVAQTANELDAVNNQNGTLMRLLSEKAGVRPEEIIDFDLSVVDTQPPSLGGAHDEFINSARLDNLISCYCALNSLANSLSSLERDGMIRMIACFDHEEIGSASSAGANGSILVDVMERLHHSDPSKRAVCIANSFCISADGAHAAHPNYMDKHEAEHRPTLHNGPVIKYNANVRYATTASTAAVIKALAKLGNVPIQQICVKNDSPCGSTIGPILSTLTGIQSVDLGNAMMSMHSVREMAGTVDIYHLARLLSIFFDRYEEVKPM